MPSKIRYAQPSGRKPSDARREYERHPDRTEDKVFYKSPRWRELRLSVLRSQHFLCATPECRKEAAHVHHKIERKDRPDLAFATANLEGLCQPCHNRKRGERLNGRR